MNQEVWEPSLETTNVQRTEREIMNRYQKGETITE